MYIQLYIDGRLRHHWCFEDHPPQFVTPEATESRTKLWAQRVEACTIEANARWGTMYQLLIKVPSRLSPKDIPEDEFKAWDREMDRRMLDRVVEVHKPKLDNGKLT